MYCSALHQDITCKELKIDALLYWFSFRSWVFGTTPSASRSGQVRGPSTRSVHPAQEGVHKPGYARQEGPGHRIAPLSQI